METTQSTIYLLNQLAHDKPFGYHKGSTLVCGLSEKKCSWNHNPLDVPTWHHTKRHEEVEPETLEKLEPRLFDLQYEWATDRKRTKANAAKRHC